MSRRIHRARGVTLIELIVGILLVGIALTLALPLIVRIRAQAGVNAGANNMRKIGVAVGNYHDVFRSFPSQSKGNVN